MKIQWFTMSGVLLAAAIGTACNSPSTSSSPPVQADGQFTMQVDNSMEFGTKTLAVHAGQPLQLTLQNTGSSQHDFSLSEGVAQPIRIEAAGGQTAEGTFVIQKPGTYDFVCSQPGHSLAGMRGTIVVQ